MRMAKQHPLPSHRISNFMGMKLSQERLQRTKPPAKQMRHPEDVLKSYQPPASLQTPTAEWDPAYPNPYPYSVIHEPPPS